MAKIVIIYKSSTGFTEKYARLLAERLGGTAADFKKAGRIALSDFDTVIFGTRAHAGSIDGFTKFRKIFRQKTGTPFLLSKTAQHASGIHAPSCILFVTGAAPETEQDMIQKLWKDNLTEDELACLPHFYMPAGLCYEKMCLIDRIMMKGLSAMIKQKKDKTDREIELERRISASFELFSEEYAESLLNFVRNQYRA